MKQAHTSGPWQAKHKRTLGDPMVPFLVYDIGKEGDPPLACVSNADVYMKPDELEANALLMAAAPEMLAALNQVERAWVGDGIGMSTAVDSCLLAIAKATEANQC